MKVLVTSGHLDPGVLPGGTARVVDLETLLCSSDYVSLHGPLTDKNRHMMNKDSFRKMKKSAYVINTSRGPLICEEDLKEAVLNRTIAGAAVDVAEEEPMRADSPLLDVEGILVTPHIAWASREARERLMRIAEENLKQYVAGTPVHVVSEIPRVH